MSNRLRQVHHLYADERKKCLGRARFSVSHKHCSGLLPRRPTHTLKEMRCVRKNTSSVLKPAKVERKVTASMLTKSYPDFNFCHKFSLLVVSSTRSGKTYFVQQILEHSRIDSIKCVLSHDIPYNPIASGRHIENLRIHDDVKKL